MVWKVPLSSADQVLLVPDEGGVTCTLSLYVTCQLSIKLPVIVM